ncbi:acyl carrier protein [Myxococcota bacterium]|nr:acyl carrier protein [Myxococcota bacterium]
MTAPPVDEVRRILGRELGTDPPPADARLDSLGLDSLSRIGVAVALEDAFRIRLDDADADGAETVADLALLVARALGEGS